MMSLSVPKRKRVYIESLVIHAFPPPPGVPGVEAGVPGVDADVAVGDDDRAIIFCLTSRILSCRHTLEGKASQCLNWKLDVAWLEGNRPCSWNSCITSCLRWSRVFRSEEGRPPPGPPGVVGDDDVMMQQGSLLS